MILREAEAYRERRNSPRSGETQRFLQALREYQAAKEITRKRLLLETLEEVLPQMDKIILEERGRYKCAPNPAARQRRESVWPRWRW